jgi:catechol 2,3-dioxygenase
MALTGVTRPGHIQLRVLDLEESVEFYTNVLGLVETGRDTQGRVYFKTFEERDHHSFIIREAPEAGMDFIGFKVLNEATLDLLETGERVRFTLPTGHEMELFATKTILGNPLGDFNPKPYNPGLDHGISPVRFDHALLYGPNVNDALALLTDVLGFHLTEYVTLPETDIKGALWLACSNKAHDLAFVEHPEPGRFHHVAFLMESWERVLRAADIMSTYDVTVDIGPTRHGITRGGTIYAWDPSGNRFETFQGGLAPYPDWGPIRWDWSGLGEGGGLDVAKRVLHETFLTVLT